MPTYEYECGACAHRFEQWQPFSAAALTDCSRCGQPRLQRLFGSGGAIIFKGSGFYETDYRRTQQSQGAAKERTQDAAANAVSSTTSSGATSDATAPASGSNSSQSKD